MSPTLESEGWIRKGLFVVEGAMVAHYNRALMAAIGRETKLSTFRVDKRGESPEIAAELGWNYLQRSPSDRYLIVVSPLQRGAPLMHEEFSFDNEVIDAIYERHLPAIDLITRVDGLWGELDDDLRVIHTLDDLLALHEIKVELHTPSEFLAMARRLQAELERLREDPDLLTADDSALLKEIHQLAGEVGDVRECNVTDLRVSHEIGSFSTRLFDGVYVFREADPPLELRRPTGSGDRAAKDGPVRLQQVLFYDAEKHSPTAFGPDVEAIPLQSRDRIVNFLVRRNCVEFAPELVELRMSQLEDLQLASSGYDLRKFSDVERRQVLAQHHDDLPESWNRLMELKRRLDTGRTFDELTDHADDEIRAMLLRSKEDSSDPREIVESLLSTLWPHDYGRMYRYNTVDLEILFERAEEWQRKYVLYCLEEIRERESLA